MGKERERAVGAAEDRNLRLYGGHMKQSASQGALVVKNLPTNAGDERDGSSIPGSGRSSGGGSGNPWMEEPGGLQSTGSHRVGHD